jgi:hypothetical protein
MPAVNDVCEPCAREPQARFDGRALETEQPREASAVPRLVRWTSHPDGLVGDHLDGHLPPRQRSTLHGS